MVVFIKPSSHNGGFYFDHAEGMFFEILYDFFVDEVLKMYRVIPINYIRYKFLKEYKIELEKFINQVFFMSRKGLLPKPDTNIMPVINDEFLKMTFYYIGDLDGEHRRKYSKYGIVIRGKGYIEFECMYEDKKVCWGIYYDEPSLTLEVLTRWFEIRDKVFNQQK